MDRATRAQYRSAIPVTRPPFCWREGRGDWPDCHVFLPNWPHESECRSTPHVPRAWRSCPPSPPALEGSGPGPSLSCRSDLRLPRHIHPGGVTPGPGHGPGPYLGGRGPLKQPWTYGWGTRAQATRTGRLPPQSESPVPRPTPGSVLSPRCSGAACPSAVHSVPPTRPATCKAAGECFQWTPGSAQLC